MDQTTFYWPCAIRRSFDPPVSKNLARRGCMMAVRDPSRIATTPPTTMTRLMILFGVLVLAWGVRAGIVPRRALAWLPCHELTLPIFAFQPTRFRHVFRFSYIACTHRFP